MSGRHDVSILPPRDAEPQRKDYVLVDIPEYETYSLLSLYQVLNGIRGDLYPEVYEALEQEIGRRVPESVTELEDCYFALDKDKHPGYEARLRSQIEQLGGFQRTRIEPITEDNKYATFWRRFWAHIFDTVVVAVPLVAGGVAAEKTGLIQSVASPQLQVLFQFVAVAYFVILHGACGQTVGKMATGVKVLDVSERRAPGWLQALARDAVPLLLILVSMVYVLGFGATPAEAEAAEPAAAIQIALALIVPVWALAEMVTMLFSRKRRALHDFIARTVVIRIAN